jgi:hypothetical protein
MDKIFCTKCGEKLDIELVESEYFDSSTGRKCLNTKHSCPSKLCGHDGIYCDYQHPPNWGRWRRFWNEKICMKCGKKHKTKYYD